MITQSSENNGWFKSTDSFANGGCVEVQFLTDGGVQVRNSRDRDGATLTYTSKEWTSFLAGAKLGEFDLPGSDPQ